MLLRSYIRFGLMPVLNSLKRSYIRFGLIPVLNCLKVCFWRVPPTEWQTVRVTVLTH